MTEISQECGQYYHTVRVGHGSIRGEPGHSGVRELHPKELKSSHDRFCAQTYSENKTKL